MLILRGSLNMNKVHPVRQRVKRLDPVWLIHKECDAGPEIEVHDTDGSQLL
jgi:hypothetical protein